MFTDVQDLIWHLRERVSPETDYDCVLFFTGTEGRGKSTLEFQFGRAVDPPGIVEHGSPLRAKAREARDAVAEALKLEEPPEVLDARLARLMEAAKSLGREGRFRHERAQDFPEGREYRGFDATRMHFDLQSFFHGIGTHHAMQADVWDEGDVNSRGAMERDRRALNKTLQFCRGMRRFLFVAYPRAEYADQLLLERTYLNIHVPRRGLFQVRKYIGGRAKQTHPKARYRSPWKVLWQCSFDKNSGPLWKEYQRKKEDKMKETLLELAGVVSVPAQRSPRDRCEDLGFDVDELDAALAELVAAA